MRKAILAIGLVALGAGGAIWADDARNLLSNLVEARATVQNTPVRPAGPPATPVIVTSVAPLVFIDSFSTVATASPRESVVLTALVEDVVTRIAFEEGSDVEEGQLLVELHADQARARLEAARARLAEAEAAYIRAENLAGRGTVSQAVLDEEMAERDVQRAEVERLSAELSDHIIEAPFSGTIGIRRVSIGSYVEPGTEIALLQDLSVIRAEFTVPERLLARVAPGLPVTVTAEAFPDRAFAGAVTLIEPRVNPETRAIAIRAEIDNRHRQLKPGMLLRLGMELGAHEGLAVPEGALLPVGNEVFVFRVVDGVAERVAVTIGRRQGTGVEVLSGLEEGDSVIVDGALRVRAGNPVEIIEETVAGGSALRSASE